MLLHPIGYKIDAFIHNYTRKDAKTTEKTYFCAKIDSLWQKELNCRNK